MSAATRQAFFDSYERELLAKAEGQQTIVFIAQITHSTRPLGRFTLRALMINELQHLQYLIGTGQVLTAPNGDNLAEAIGNVDDGRTPSKCINSAVEFVHSSIIIR